MKSDIENKKLIIVLGTGRSGTSLLMQILHAAGVQCAGELIGANKSNPRGHLEDKHIVEAQQEFFDSLHQEMLSPIMNDDLLRSKESHLLKRKLEDSILTKLNNCETNFCAIKDPRISVLLPIWQEIFKKNNIQPIYLFASRNPQSVITSLMTYYSNFAQSKAESEWLWLQRTISSFYYVKSQFFVVHYEYWFTKPQKQLKNILQYIDNEYFLKINTDEIIKSTIDHNLNRSHVNGCSKNKKIDEIYEVIKKIDGVNSSFTDIQIFFEKQMQDMQSYMSWLIPILQKKYESNHNVLQKLYIQKNLIKQKDQIIKQKNEVIKQKDQIIKQKKQDLEKINQIQKHVQSSFCLKTRHTLLFPIRFLRQPKYYCIKYKKLIFGL